MTFYYNGKHSVKFGDYDSWKDWHLIPKSRPVINPPIERTTFETIPGRQGKIDLSWSVINGLALYDNRTGSMTFYVDTDQWKSWHIAYHTILSQLQGRRVTVILSDDPSFYYSGMCYVDAWNSEERYSTIAIKYDLSPFKRRVEFKESTWIWDTFDFEQGAIGRVDLTQTYL